MFTPALVASLEPGIRSTFDHILAGIGHHAKVDFMTDVAVLLPAYVILDMLGVPREDFAGSRSGRMTCACSWAHLPG